MENAGALSPTFNAIAPLPCRKMAPTMPLALVRRKPAGARSFKTPDLLSSRTLSSIGSRLAKMDGLLGFILAGFALAGSPGPATLSLAAAGAAFGARRSLGYMAGQIAGLVAVMA